MKSLTVLLFIGALFFFGNATAQEKFQLEYKYRQDQTYRYQEESKYESTQEINGQEFKATGSTFSLMNMTIKNVSENGDLTFLGFLEDYKVVAKSAYMDTTMVMKDILNRNIQTIISKKGRMIEKQLLDTTNIGTDFFGKGDGLLSVYKEFAIFPDQEVKFGDTWNDERTDTAKGTQMVTLTKGVYTLLAVEEKNNRTCLKISFTGKTEISGKMTQMGMEFFMEGSGESTGTLWFDQKAGILIAKESTIDQDMTMALTGQMQMTIPITSSTNTTYNLIE